MLATIIVGFLLLLSLIAIVILVMRFNKLNALHTTQQNELDGLKQRFEGILSADAERQKILGQLAYEREQLNTDISNLRKQKESEIEQTKRAVETERQNALKELSTQREKLQAEINNLQTQQQRFSKQLQEQKDKGLVEYQSIQANIERVRRDMQLLDEEAYIQSFGFYKPRYDFASSKQYQLRLEEIREQQKTIVKTGKAAVCYTEWAVNDSKIEGRKQTNRTLKLMLRAFNGECDASIAKVKYNNVTVMEQRIYKAREAINKLVEIQKSEITFDYLKLKLQELYLVHEYQEKVQEEKEEQRRIREQMREEEIARREIEKAQLDAEREEARYADALRKAQEEAERAVGAKQQKLLTQIEELQRKLEEAHTNKERAIAHAQLTRSGHVYVISNIGSFGEDVFKIGMTRRLDPYDRVLELGDASVPFRFDVHAIIYSEDAPTLENKLHRIFNERRVNRVNERKEFFRVSLDEIAKAVLENHGEIEFVHVPEAPEYRKTVSMLASVQTEVVSQTTATI